LSTFKDLKSLEKFLNKEIQRSLETDVANKVVKVAKDHVQKDVYDEYPNPKEYQRTGKLKDNFEVNKVPDGIEIENTRADGDRDIVEIVEYGHANSEQGYEYPAYYPNGYNFIQPRPFIENTKKQIAEENIHVDELKRSLKSKGFDII